MYTTHGHHILGTPGTGLKNPVKCGGPEGLCPKCITEVATYHKEETNKKKGEKTKR